MIVASVALILYAPLIARWLLPDSENWSQLSDMGQAYGAPSAIISGLACCGLVGSLFVNGRQLKSARQQLALTQQQVQMAHIVAARERHFELLKLGLDNPDLIVGVAGNLSSDEARPWLIRNMWVAHWAMLWDLGQLRQDALSSLLTDFFSDPVSRAWWTATGWSGWSRDGGSAFVKTAELVYFEACRRTNAEVSVRRSPAKDTMAPQGLDLGSPSETSSVAE